LYANFFGTGNFFFLEIDTIKPPFLLYANFFGTQEMQPQLDEIDAIETSVDELLNTAQVTT
jgi:hypothetical protein